MWRSCVEFFAAGTWHDRRWHVMQRRLEWDGREGCKWLATCMPSWPYARRSCATGGAARRRSQLASWSTPAAETSWAGPRTPVAGLGTLAACGRARTGSYDP